MIIVIRRPLLGVELFWETYFLSLFHDRIPNESEPLPEELAKPIAVAADLVVSPDVPLIAGVDSNSDKAKAKAVSGSDSAEGKEGGPSDGMSVKALTAEEKAEATRKGKASGEDSPGTVRFSPFIYFVNLLHLLVLTRLESLFLRTFFGSFHLGLGPL